MPVQQQVLPGFALSLTIWAVSVMVITCPQGLYFTPANCEDPHAELSASFNMLAEACLEEAAPTRIVVAMGRHLDVPHASAPLPLAFP